MGATGALGQRPAAERGATASSAPRCAWTAGPRSRAESTSLARSGSPHQPRRDPGLHARRFFEMRVIPLLHALARGLEEDVIGKDQTDGLLAHLPLELPGRALGRLGSMHEEPRNRR